MTKPLALPSNTAHLVDALADHHDLLALLRETNTLIGGGSILAAHWNNHRRSMDIDLMMPAQHFNEHLKTIAELIQRISAQQHVLIPSRTGETVVVRAQNVHRKDGDSKKEGDLEIVQDALGDILRLSSPDRPPRPVKILGLTAEPKEHILAKKFNRLEDNLERDHYDILWAAYNDRQVLINAIVSYIEPELIEHIANEAAEKKDALFSNQKKKVIDPKAKDWKSVLPDVWAAIERMSRDPSSRSIKLPPLKGAKNKKAVARRQRGTGS